MPRKPHVTAAEPDFKIPSDALQYLLDSSSVAMFSVDRNYRYTAFNRVHAQRMKTMFGVDIEPGGSMLEYMTVPEVRAKAKQNIDRALTGEEFTDISYSGEAGIAGIFIGIHHIPIKDEKGAVIGVTVSFEDVTELKKTEDALKNSEDLYLTTFVNASIGVALVSKTGRFLRANPAFCEMLGYSETELSGMTFNDVTFEEEKAVGLSFVKDVHAGLANSIHFEKRYVCKDGSLLWADVSSVAFRNAAGEFQYLITHVQDITQSKKVQQELLDHQTRLDELVRERTQQLTASEALYRSLFDNISLTIVVFNPQSGNILDANPAACTFFERSYADLLQTNIPDLVAIHPEDLHTHAGKFRSGQIIFIEAAYRRASGDIRNLGVYPRLIQFKQGQAVLAVIHDITESKRAEQILKDSETALRTIIDTIPGLIWSSRPDGYIDYVNQGWLSFTGLTQEQAQGTGWMQALHPDDDDTWPKWAESTRTGSLYEVEQRLRRFDGEYHWFLTRAQPVRDTDGNVLKFYGVNTDITGRKEAEKAIQASEELFRTSFENATAGVSLVDPRGRFLRVNHKLCDILGYTREELAQLTFNDVTHPEDKDIGISLMKQLVSGEMESTSLEKRYIHKDGHIVWVFVSSAAVRNPAGEVQYFVAHTQDITERRQMEDKLRQHSRAVESSPSSIIITDVKGNIEYVNPKFTLVTGYTSEEALGKNPRLIQSGRTPRAEYQKMWETILAGEEWHGEFHNKKKNGELFYESVSISPIVEADGKISHFIAVKEDITGRKQDQQRILDGLAFNQTIIDSSPIGITIYNAAGDCITANHAAAQIARSDPETLRKQNIHTIESWKTSGMYKAALQTLKTGQPVSLQCHITLTESRDLWLDATFVTFKSAGEDHLLLMFEDNSERQKAEKDLTSSNQKLEVLVNDLERGQKDAYLLRQMSDMLQVCAGVQEAFAVIGQFAPQIFPDNAGAVFMTTQNHRSMEAVCSWGTGLASELVFSVDACWSLRRNQVYSHISSLPGLKCLHMPNDFAGCYLDIPLQTSGETMGLLHLERPGADKPGRTTQEVAQIFADNISLSLSNIKLRETLHNQSVRDPLTHAFNRRYMEETLDRELPRARRRNSQVGLIMLDIDKFKRYNDAYGHAAGDLVLTRLADLMQAQVRGEDVVCRLGGEEFLIIMPDAGREVTLQRAEAIRTAAQALKIEYTDQSLGAITVSIGVAVYPVHGSNSEEIIRMADTALYRAKNNGRNRVEVSDSPAA